MSNSNKKAPQTQKTQENGPQRIRINHLHQWKEANHKWGMLTAYDYQSARIFDNAGVPVLLVGDSAANVVYGYDSTIQLPFDELLPLVKAVSRGAQHALVIADLPFGSYESSPQQAFTSATILLKEGGAAAVKLEGGAQITTHVKLLSSHGIPVMGHLGFTPQSIHTLGGYKVQGTHEKQAEILIEDAHALYNAGVFGIVLEMVPSELAKRITEELPIPIVGIGAGKYTDAQVLVWQDAVGLTQNKVPKFVKRFDNLAENLTSFAHKYLAEVSSGEFPGSEHSY